MLIGVFLSVKIKDVEGALASGRIGSHVSHGCKNRCSIANHEATARTTRQKKYDTLMVFVVSDICIQQFFGI